MKPRTKQKTPKKRRFRIERLEERIAPKRGNCHFNKHGKIVGCGKCDYTCFPYY